MCVFGISKEVIRRMIDVSKCAKMFYFLNRSFLNCKKCFKVPYKNISRNHNVFPKNAEVFLFSKSLRRFSLHMSCFRSLYLHFKIFCSNSFLRFSVPRGYVLLLVYITVAKSAYCKIWAFQVAVLCIRTLNSYPQKQIN